ncbi:ABC transporter permease [Acuticoccus mangrovi]|uniref:ABC transporter permease n=1 Tax=Acuticoccus mangrovi TaxID=2796142 RepID=A0A934MK04_9HYPH|nr:ABC transporter permease [Acuticoccus mangrovi]MBJ3775049.1 ABC transporter permease [Acuticoccus mangrovi]
MSEFLPPILARYGDDLLDGFWITLQLVGLSIGFGIVLASLSTRARLSKRWWLRWLSAIYINLFRGTPLIAQLFLIYYGLGQFSGLWRTLNLWWFLRDPFNCAVLAFTLNTAAYQAEIFRGAVEAVPRGQWEGASALGLPRHIGFLKVIVPQAAIYALRPFGNEIILMVKGSAVASVVTVYDLLGETRLAFSDTFRFDVYFYAAALYLVLVETLRRVWNLLEARLTRHLDPASKQRMRRRKESVLEPVAS